MDTAKVARFTKLDFYALAFGLAFARLRIVLSGNWHARQHKKGYQNWYNAITKLTRMIGEDIQCLNYGYSPDPGAEYMEDKNQLALYELLIHEAGLQTLNGLTVIEVGSGRGGGLDHVCRAFSPQKATGVDLSTFAVDECNQRYDHPQLSFIQGDAMDLPFEDRSADVVLNVESSHCYPGFRTFLSETHRVLKDDGKLLFADFRYQKDVDDVKADFLRTGYRIEVTDITDEVIAAMDADQSRKTRVIMDNPSIPRFIKRGLISFAGCQESTIYKNFVSRERRYLSIIATKPH